MSRLVSGVLGSLVNRAVGFALDTPVTTTAALEMFLLLGLTIGGAACLAPSLWASAALLVWRPTVERRTLARWAFISPSSITLAR